MNKNSYYYKYLKYKKKYSNASKIQNGGNISNSLWIKEDFFSQNEFEDILNDLNELKPKEDKRSSNRCSLCINKEKYKNIYDKIYKNEKFISFMNSIKDDNVRLKLEPSYPIEYRKYFTGSKGMDWHQDTSMFEPDCFEIVLTLTNNSDSKFEWMDGLIKNSVSPKPNTLAIVRPKSVIHSVSPVNNGERTILKFIMEFIEDGKEDNTKKISLDKEIDNCPI